jgi:hypothetical protein
MAVTMMRRRQATPARWQRALERAMLASVQVRQLAGTGAWIVTSASDPNAAYETDGQSCTCPAAMLGGDDVCLHRAAYWHARGLLELDRDPEPPTPAAPALTVVCPDCGGDRYRRVYTGGRLSDWIAAPCQTCHETGSVSVNTHAA